MNGVRRFLAGNTSPNPLSPSSTTFQARGNGVTNGGGWTPQISSPHQYSEPVSPDSPPLTMVSAAPVGIRKSRKDESGSVYNKDEAYSGDNNATSKPSGLPSLQQHKSMHSTSKPVAGPSSPPRQALYSPLTPNGQGRVNQTPPVSRDDLLVSLLSSEAVVDSREFEILSSEEIEDLKRVILMVSSSKSIAHYGLRNKHH